MRDTLRQSLAICCLALAPTLGAMLLHPKQPGWDPNTLLEGEILLSAAVALGQEVLWIDARSSQEYEKRHISHAVLLNEDQWDQLLGDALDHWRPGQPVVVYCDSRFCKASLGVARRLREEGVNPVYVLKGGWETWEASTK